MAMITTRVLSFDVGVRHLAFVDATVTVPAPVRSRSRDVDVTRDEGDFCIHKWDVLDLSGGALPPHTPPAPCKTKGSSDKKKGGVGVGERPDPVRRVIEALDEQVFDDPTTTWDVVLIENQPVLKNPVMKTIQVAIHAYFVMLSIHFDNVGAVRLASPSLKARLFPVVKAEGDGDGDGDNLVMGGCRGAKPSSYKARKALSIQAAHALLSDGKGGGDAAKWKGVFERSKKKDDLSDCLLQALSHVGFHGKPAAKR